MINHIRSEKHRKDTKWNYNTFTFIYVVNDMKREKLRFASIVLACILLFSACGSTCVYASNKISGYEYGQTLYVVNCKEWISLRTKPSTSSEAILRIPLFAGVTYFADADNGFLNVSYHGKSGYALAKYLDEFEPQIAIGEYMEVYKCKKSITLRKEASTKAKEICQIPLGAVVYVVKEAANGFYMVVYNGLEGYALSSYLRTVSSESDWKKVDKTDYYYGQSLSVVGVNESISLREEPSTSSDAILQIPLYASVTYLEDAPNGFVHVVYNNVDGYALSKYLDEYEPQIAICEYMRVVNCKESITLRKTASTSGNEICQIPLGDIVYAIKEAANGFLMVEYNGKQGYALRKYLEFV